MSTSTLPRVATALFGGDPWYAAHVITPGDPDTSGVLWRPEPVLKDGLRWAEPDEITEATDALTVVLDRVAFAELLYASGILLDDDTSDEEIRAGVFAQLGRCHCDLRRCAGRVAQEAGDQPDAYLARITACLTLAARIVRTEAS